MKKIIVFLMFLPVFLSAAPKAELWDVWTPYNPGSGMSINHSAWNEILEMYLKTGDPSGVHLFAYSEVDDASRNKLDAYLGYLQGIAVGDLNRKEQMAYWINLYNALTVQVILENWPVDSIRDINLGGGGLFGRGPWDAPLALIEGRDVSLNDIEHRILRPIWKDPRIHYAVNCASIGCPNLADRAFTADNLEELLEAGAVSYINNPRGAEVDGNTLHLSSIYDWFSADFGETRKAILEHVHSYAEPELRNALSPFIEGKGRLRYRYDWNVNTAR
jgi:hypothetical protein